MSGSKYFVGGRNEINEIQQSLRNPSIINDPPKMREVVKRVIAYMTLGLDMSRVCSDMIMASNTRDPVQKKMVYQYLTAYAKPRSEVAILAINTLQRDCRDEDPMTRGLALRTLGSLRIDNIVEYVMQPLRKGLNDPSPYVRKTAVVGVAKLYKLEPSAVRQSDLVDVLYNQLKDKDPEVVSNVIAALDEILGGEGGMVINSAIVTYLLNRIREFTEWGQCSVLAIVAKYQPANQDEMRNMMNLLDDRLSQSNSAVVLATTKVFLNFTKDLPDFHLEVFKRLKAPLLTLVTGGSVEVAYVVLTHILLLVERAPGVFDDQYKNFYCRMSDTAAVKMLRLKILTLLANETNMVDVMNELSEYVTDVNADIARAAIRGLGKVALKLEQSSEQAIEHLIGQTFPLLLETEYITSSAIIVVKDLLRKYPERYEEVIPYLQKSLKSIEEENGKVAVIWTVGEYGGDEYGGEYIIPDAPYFLEELINGLEDEPSHAIRMELLSASVKLFFKRPPEMQKMLGLLLRKCIADTAKVDVRDRALLYYRLLQADVLECARVVNCPKSPVEGKFAEAMETELQNKLFNEFNSLSVVYQIPSEFFAKYVPEDEDEEEEQEEAETPLSPGLDESAADGADEDGNYAYDGPNRAASPAPGAEAGGGDTSSLDDFLGGGISAPAASAPSVSLLPNPTVDKMVFQQQWGSLPVGPEIRLQSSAAPQTALSALKAANFAVLASGLIGQTMKVYLYCRDSSSQSLMMTEMLINQATGEISSKTKLENQELAGGFEQLFRGALASTTR